MSTLTVDSMVPRMTEWKKVNKLVVVASSPKITVRRDGLALNKLSAELAGLDGGVYYADVFIGENGRKVGLKFSSTKQDGAYKTKKDGGTGATNIKSYHIACGAALFSAAPNLTQGDKFDFHYSGSDGIYYFLTGNSFDKKVSDRKPKFGELGVYRYLMDDDVVYIGQGVLQSRLADHAKKDWEFDDIEYTILESKPECESFESECLIAFKHQNGRLPFYNRVLGRKNES